MFQDELVEKWVLAYLIRDLKYVIIAQQFVSEDFFAFTNLRRMYRAIMAMYNRHRTVLQYQDLATMLDKTKNVPEHERTAILVLFRELEAMEPDNTRFTVYLDALSDLKIKRGLNSVIEQYRDQLTVAEGPELLQAMGQDLYKLRIDAKQTAVSKGFVFQNVKERLDEYRRKQLHGDIGAIPYGMKRLDELTGGHFPGEVATFFSRMGGGKTRLLHTISYNASLAGKKGLFVTIEMGRHEILRLNDSRLCHLEYGKLKRGTLSPEQEQAWQDLLYMKEQSGDWGPMVIHIPRGCTTASIEEEVNVYEREYGKLDYVVIDYLTLMDSVERDIAREDKFGNIAKELKQMAHVKQVSVVTAVQANRKATEVEDPKMIGTEHMGLSDQIPAHCNTICYLYRTAYDKAQNTLHLNVVKSRDGELDDFVLVADWPMSFIGDKPKEPEPEPVYEGEEGLPDEGQST